MKMFIAIACLALIAGTYGAESEAQPPRSLVGNLWRFKGGLANNMGDFSDRIIDRVKSLSPLRLFNVNLAASVNSGTTSKPTPIPKPVGAPATHSATASASASNSNSATNPPPVVSSTTLKPVNCSEEESVNKKLVRAQKHSVDADTAAKQFVQDEKDAKAVLATTPEDGPAKEKLKKSQAGILDEQTKRESADLLVNDLVSKLSVYIKSCQ